MEYKKVFFDEFRYKIAKGKSIVWMLNIEAERFWYSIEQAIKSDSHSFLAQTEYINFLLCKKQDYLIVHKKPDKSFINYLMEQGCEIPTILVPNASLCTESISEKVLDDKKLISFLREISNTVVFMPYAVTYLEEKIVEQTGIKLMASNARSAKLVNNKVFARQLSLELDLPVCRGEICSNVQQAIQYYRQYFIGEKCVLKNAYGASGNGIYVIENEKQLLRILNRAKELGFKGSCIIEKWYDEKIDLNYQFYISEAGEIVPFSVKEQIMAITRYVGSVIPPRIDPIDEYYDIITKIGNKLYEYGYWGNVSIDGMITNECFIPILEINGRLSLSSYISFFQDIFHYTKAVSKYYDLFCSDQASFEFNLSCISSIAYSKTKVIVYNYCCSFFDKNRVKYRIFILYLGDSHTQIFSTIQQIETMIRKINNK